MLAQVRPNGQDDNPTFKINVDREKAAALGVALSDVDQTFSIAWARASSTTSSIPTTGSSGLRAGRCAVSHEPGRPEAALRAQQQGGHGAVLVVRTGEWAYGPPKLERYNGVASMEIQGQAAPGHSTGQAMLAMEALAKKLPAGVGYEWTGISLAAATLGRTGTAALTRSRSWWCS